MKNMCLMLFGFLFISSTAEAAAQPVMLEFAQQQITASDLTAWNLPEKAKSAIEAMIANGVDIGYAVAGHTNVGMFQAFKAAREAGNEVWGIGVDSDRYNVAAFVDFKNVILTSMLKRFDIAVFEVIEGVASGSPLVGVQNFDLKRGGVGYAFSNPAVAPYQAAADAAALAS